MKKDSKTKTILHSIKNLDYFGVFINFQFKDKDKYKSIFGGMIFLVYFIFSMIYLFLNFGNFAQRKQFNLIYNEWVEQEARAINFANFSTGIAIGITMDDPTKFTFLYEHLDVEFFGVTFEKKNGTFSKKKTPFQLEKCEKFHFYNSKKESFDSLGLVNYLCPNLTNFEIKGIYTEDIFKYFEFSVSAKKTANMDAIKKLVVENEIKAQIYYMDTAIKIDTIDQPIQRFVNSAFSVLDFDFYKKTNLDFMMLNFVSDENIFFLSNNPQSFMVLAEKQEYFNYIGRDRLSMKPRDWSVFTKIYIRASPKSRLTKRLYLKLTEYLANMSSILSSILLILFLIISQINLFKGRQNLIRKILKFKDDNKYKVDDNVKYFKEKFTNDRVDVDKELDFYSENKNCIKRYTLNLNNDLGNKLRSTTEQSFSYEINREQEINSNKERNYKIYHKSEHNEDYKYKNANFEDDKSNRNLSRGNIISINEINKNNQNKYTKINPIIKSTLFGNNKLSKNLFPLLDSSNNTIKLENRTINENSNNTNYISNDKSLIVSPIPGIINKDRRATISVPKFKLRSQTIINNNSETIQNNKNVSFGFNVCEIFTKLICICCPNKKIKIKTELQKRGYEKFNHNMNIMTYLKKMQEIDILKFLLLNEDQINLFNYISKPTISLGSQNVILESLHKKFKVKQTKNEIDKLFNSFNSLFGQDKNKISEFDKKLLDIVSSEIDNLMDG